MNNLDEPIKEGYFPKLDSLVAGRTWPPRLDDQKLRDINRHEDGIMVSIKQLNMWRDRIYDAINSGVVRTVSNYLFIFFCSFNIQDSWIPQFNGFH